MNLAELRSAVERRSGIPYGPDAMTDVVNEATLRCGLAQDWPWLIQTQDITATEDQDEETLDYEPRRVLMVTIDGREVKPIAVADADVWEETGGSVNFGYALAGSTLILKPTPAGDEAYIVRYVANEPRLVNDDDTPLMPDAYHDCIVNMASEIVCERMGETARAAGFHGRYEDWLHDMRRNARKAGRGSRITVRPGGGL